MARRSSKSTPAQDLGDFTEKIVDIDVEEEMQGAFLEYAYSVIYSRALPDARDGLKPVQRRILFGMNELGVRPERPHVKSRRGNCLRSHACQAQRTQCASHVHASVKGQRRHVYVNEVHLDACFGKAAHVQLDILAELHQLFRDRPERHGDSYGRLSGAKGRRR